MKKIVIYIVLLTYVIVQLRPLTAVVQDVLAHTFFKMQHMTTIHYENGKYHLHNDLKTIEDNGLATHKSEKSSSQKTNEKASEHLISSFSVEFNSTRIILNKKMVSVLDIHSGFIKINSPPPQIVS